MVVLNRVLNVLNEIRGVIILTKISVIPVRHDYWGSFVEVPAITTATTTSSSKTSEMPTTENATPTITVSDSTTELFKSIKEYLNSDLSIKSADYVYEFLRKVKDVPRIDRGHVINILTQTHDPIILQKLVNDRCSYILRNWIKEEAKQLSDSNLLLRLLKTVQHLPVDFEVSTSCGLGRVVNNKLVKESSIPGVADMASKLLNRWLQDARQLSESAELNQPVVKGIFEDMFDFSNIGNSSLSSTSSSNIFKPQLSNVFKIKDSTKTTLKSEKFETKQVKLFENKYPDDMEDDMSSLPVGVCHVKDLDRSEGRTAFKRMRKAPSTIWYTPLLLKPSPSSSSNNVDNKCNNKIVKRSSKTNSQEANIQESREKQTLEVIYLTGKSIEKLKQKIELKKVLNDTPFANPNSWVYDPNQNASNNVGLGIGVAAGLIPGIGTVNNSIDSNSNNQIMPNYYYHHPNPNIPAPAPSASLPLLNQPLVNDQNQIINRPPTNLTNITTTTANNNNNRGGGGRIGPSSSGTGRPTSGKGSECWYYKAGRCTLGNECNFLHSDH
nr:2928_t:CDS:2 [Entrophospora candida]